MLKDLHLVFGEAELHILDAGQAEYVFLVRDDVELAMNIPGVPTHVPTHFHDHVELWTLGFSVELLLAFPKQIPIHTYRDRHTRLILRQPHDVI